MTSVSELDAAPPYKGAWLREVMGVSGVLETIQQLNYRMSGLEALDIAAHERRTQRTRPTAPERESRRGRGRPRVNLDDAATKMCQAYDEAVAQTGKSQPTKEEIYKHWEWETGPSSENFGNHWSRLKTAGRLPPNY